MAFAVNDRVKETSTTSGAGTYSLAGAVAAFQTFVAGIASGNTCPYFAFDGTDWEVGIGTVTDASPDTLSRDSILQSSNADAAVSWPGGTITISCGLPASLAMLTNIIQTITAAKTFNDTTLKLAGATSGASTLKAPAVASTYVHTLPAATATLAGLSLAQTYTAAQTGSITGLTDAANISTNLALNNFFSVTLAGNRTLDNPTNIVAGQSGCIFITQDATGSRTLAYGSYWDFAGGTAPTLSTAASSVDRLDYVVRTTTSIHAVLTKAWS